MSSQSSGEKRRLDSIWRAHPQVIALTAAFHFANAWIRENGELPDSGIKCD